MGVRREEGRKTGGGRSLVSGREKKKAREGRKLFYLFGLSYARWDRWRES